MLPNEPANSGFFDCHVCPPYTFGFLPSIFSGMKNNITIYYADVVVLPLLEFRFYSNRIGVNDLHRMASGDDTMPLHLDVIPSRIIQPYSAA